MMNKTSQILPILVNFQVVLFDASCLLYIHGANPNFKRSLRDHIEGTMNNVGTDYYIGFIDGRKNYRYDLATIAPYKGTRNKSDLLEKFPYFYEVKKELLEVYKFRLVHGLEADDVVGILNERLSKDIEQHVWICTFDGDKFKDVKIEQSSFTAVIASIDKDLLQLTGVHYNLSKHIFTLSTDENSYLELSLKRDKLNGCGFKFFYAQILMGDTADNIKGLEKCGPVKAYDILKDCKAEQQCQDATKQAFFDKEMEIAEKESRTLPMEELIKGLPSKSVLKKRALKKYEETYQLIYLLRRNKKMPEVKIEKYSEVHKSN